MIYTLSLHERWGLWVGNIDRTLDQIILVEGWGSWIVRVTGSDGFGGRGFWIGQIFGVKHLDHIGSESNCRKIIIVLSINRVRTINNQDPR